MKGFTVPFLLFGSEGRKQLKEHGFLLTAGLELVVSILVGYFGGRYLDGKLGTTPWLEYAGLIFGLVAGYRSLYRVARKAQKKLEES